MTSETGMTRARWVLFPAVGVLLIGGATRLVYIETTQGEALRGDAARQQTVTRTIPAQRGEILDTRGRVLAGTVRRPSVFVDPALVDDTRFAACSIAPVLGLDPAGLQCLLDEHRQERFIWLKRRISDDELERFKQVVGARRLRGFAVQYEPMRIYPQARLAAHVLGFVGCDAQGLGGIEQVYDNVLRGTPGRRTATVDVGRRCVRSKVKEYAPARDGATVVLTIDVYTQQIAQEALARAVEKHDAEWGTAVVVDPMSGEVLAMATVPDFDPAAAIPPGFGQMSPADRDAVKARWRNRAVTDSYEPGSIFKPFIASCALDERVTQIDEIFRINGPTHRFGRRTIHDTHAYGSLALHEIISKSSNIGMGLVGAQCGNERLYRYVRMLGFGDITGVELPGEHTGQVNDMSRWTSFSTQSVPIGQEIAVTPIQIVTAFSVFCNGGVLLRPRIVRGVIAANGETLVDRSRPVAVRRVLDEEMADVFRRRALVEVVQSGTGKQARIPGYQVFGKTGTAQIAQPDGRGYTPGAYVGSFVGGAPASRPRVVVLASIYRPRKQGYYGGVVAAPVVKEIIAETLAYMQVPQELPAEGEVASTGARPRRAR